MKSVRQAGIPTIDFTLDILDKWLFLGVFLLGATAIAVLKELGTPQLFVTGVPVALMLAYFLCVWFTPRFNLRDDHASDNLYYLGFLFTLVSLGLALYQFSSGTHGEALISNFGIALSTTIVGLALRVTLMQMRQSPAEIERLARTELAKAAIELRHQLDASITEMELFRDKIVQSTTDAIQIASTAATEAMAEQTKGFNELIARILTGFTETLDPVIAHSRKLRTASGRVVKGIEDLGDRLQTLEIPTALVRERLDGALTTVQGGIAQYVDEVRQVAEKQAAMGEQARVSTESLRGLDSAIVSLSSKLASFDAQFDRLREPLDRLAAVGPASERMAQALNAVDTALTGVGQRTDDIMQAAAAATTRMAAIADEFGAQCKAVAHAVSDVETKVISFGGAISGRGAQLDDLREPISRLAIQLRELDHLADTVQRVNGPPPILDTTTVSVEKAATHRNPVRLDPQQPAPGPQAPDLPPSVSDRAVQSLTDISPQGGGWRSRTT